MMDEVLKRLKEKWAGGSSEEAQRHTDEAMEAVRQHGTQRSGQSLTDDRINEEVGRRRLREAVQFEQDLLHWFTGEIQEKKLTRWQGYFAASLLVVNLRAGCPESAGGTAEFDRTAAGANEWWKAKNPDPPEEPIIRASTPNEADFEKGAALAQNLLDYFETEVNLQGLDRWQGHFAAALLTVELRATCPGADGGATLFDDASEAAWKYFETMSS